MAATHPVSLPVTQLQPNPLQPRGKILNDQLDELTLSIKTYGVLEPIIVAQTPAGYQIIAGERRWRAAKLAGLAEVPVIVKATTAKGMLEMAIIENLQRVDLSGMERGQAFQQLMRDFHLNQSQIAERLGKSEGFVSNTLRLLTLPDAIKDGLAGGQITEGHARALAGILDDKTMVECYKAILKEGASVRRAEELARRFKDRIGQVMTYPNRKIFHTEQLDEWQHQLQKAFSPKTKVKLVQSAVQTRVTFVLKGSPNETHAELKKILSLSKKS
jgi:ParB family chromosome partitioning protein